MIKTNELRIGNLVMMTHENTVERVNIKVLQYLVHAEAIGDEHPFAPIPLSPEILTKCGFETADQGFEYGDGEQVYRMVTQRGGYLFMILAGHQWCGAAFVKSLHHLQNIMFCLLGYD